jgi:hypothetical protein
MTFWKKSSAFFKAALLILFALWTPGPARAEPDIEFPVIFTSPQELAEFGIEIQGAGEVDGQGAIGPFPNKCYDLNGSSVGYRPITISNALLARYKAKGFTRETLCLALVSQARYDPETGKRLPTYIFRDDADIDQALDADVDTMSEDPDLIPKIFASKQAVLDAVAAFKRRDYDQLTTAQTEALVRNYNAMTEDQPLAVPPCFKNGTPYLDCNWRFGMRKGKQVSETEARRVRELGGAIDRQMKDAIASGKPIGFARGREDGGDEGDSNGYLFRRGRIDTLSDGAYDGQPENLRVPQAMLDRDTDLTWYDVSSKLPRGYAYAFFAQQPADPAFSLEALEPKRVSKRVGIKRIKKAVEEY